MDLQRIKQELQTALEQSGASVEQLRGENGLAEMKAIIGIYRKMQARMTKFELDLGDFFS